MKKYLKIGIVLMAAVLCLTLAGCGSSTSSSSGEKTYKIATDTTFAPFEFEDSSGKRVGIDVDLLTAIAEDQGFKYELDALGFDAAVSALESNQTDGVMAGMSITDARKEKFTFSDPYFDSGVVLAVKTGSPITKYEDLKGQKVAVKTGTEGATYADSIKDKYGFTVTTFPDSANMYEDVKSGNSVALFEDYPVIGYAISQGQPFTMVGEKQAGNSYGFAVNKNSEEGKKLVEMFNAGLKNVKANGKYQEILDKYIKE